MKSKILVLAMIAVGLLGFKYRDDLNTLGLKFVAPTIYDRDNVYAPEAGEIIYDSKTSKFFGRDHSNNWVELSSGAALVPPGVISAFGGTSAPNGYLPCDGTAVSRATYADLFAAIGTSFGAGNGSTTFNVPDFRGRFLRGLDSASERDTEASLRTAMNTGGNTGANLGSVQGYLTAAHQHFMFNGTNGTLSNDSSVRISNTSYVAATNWTSAGYYNSYAMNPSPSNAAATVGLTSNNGGAETRPLNAAVNYIIKY